MREKYMSIRGWWWHKRGRGERQWGVMLSDEELYLEVRDTSNVKGASISGD